MQPSFDFELLLKGKGRDASIHMRKVLADNGSNIQTLTKVLVDAVHDDFILPSVYPMWMTVTDNVHVVVYGMKQTSSRLIRQHAIRAFVKRMRHADTMQEIWEAAGQAQGIASIMKEVSVTDVKALCSGLGGCAFATSGLDQRQLLIASLLNVLYPLAGTDSPSDKRPMLPIYVRLLPACSPSLVKEWTAEFAEEKWFMTYDVTSRLAQAHLPIMEDLVLNVQQPEKWELSMIKLLISSRYEVCLDLLSRIALQEKDSAQPTIYNHITQTVSSDCTRRRLPWTFQKRFWRLVCVCFSKHPILRESPMLECPSWEKHDESFLDEQLLDELFQHTKRLKDEASIFSPMSITQKSAPSLREIVFNSYWKHANDPSIDIPDIIAQLKHGDTVERRHVSHRLDSRTLRLLPQHFLGKVIKVWDAILETDRDDPLIMYVMDTTFNRYSPTLGDDKKERRTAFKTLCGYHSSLRGSNAENLFPGARSDLLVELEHWKQKAARGRTPTDRSNGALEALQIPLILGDLPLYDETLVWARRFSKDNLTVRLIYAQSAFHNPVTIGLLSGHSFLRRDVGSLSKEGLSAYINNCHAVFNTLTESFIAASHEPTFETWSWGVFDFIGLCICCRIQAMDAIQSRLQLSDHELFSIVWQPTLNTLISLEKACLTACDLDSFFAHSFHWLNDLGGRLYFLCPSHDMGKVPEAQIHSKMSLKFIDQLAMERDRLRFDHRKLKLPEIERWPTLCKVGLSVEQLFPHYVQLSGHRPYIDSRLTAVLLMDPEVAFSEVPVDFNERSQQLIHLIHWPRVLRMYLSGTTESIRKQRINEVWDHVIRNLTRDGFGLVQTGPDWFAYFKQAGVSVREIECHKNVVKAASQISLPSNMFDNDWDPNSSIRFHHNGTGKETYIDCFTHNSTFQHGSIPVEESRRKDKPPCFWTFIQSTDRHRLVAAGGDAVIEAAILSLEASRSSKRPILETEMPGNVNTRFPVVSFSADFIRVHLNTPQQTSQAMDILWDLRQRIPSILVARLAESILSDIEEMVDRDESPAAMSYELTVRLIDIVFRGDKPSLALPIAAKFIDRLNTESLQHPRILNVGLFNRLQPDAANKYLSEISDLILSRLERAKAETPTLRTKKDEDAIDEDSASESKQDTTHIVKTATVQLVPQIIRHGLFTDGDQLLHITKRLLFTTKTLSVKAAILEALLVKMDTNKDDWQQYAEVIEQNLVSVAGSLNEDFPESEGTWRIAERSGKLPKPYDQSQGSPKLLTCLFKLLHRRNESLIRIFTNTIHLSIQNNKRWAQLFLRKIGEEVDLDELPDSPVYPTILLDLLENHYEDMPESILKILAKERAAKLNPSPKMRRIQRIVEAMDGEDTELIDHKRHYVHSFITWYSASSQILPKPGYAEYDGEDMWAGSRGVLHQDRYTRWILRQLTDRKIKHPSISDSVIDTLAFEHASAICWSGREPTLQLLGMLLMPQRTLTGPLQPESRIMPVVDKMKAVVETIRSQIWANNKPQFPYYTATPEQFEIFLLSAQRYKTLPEDSPLELHLGFARDIIALLRRILQKGTDNTGLFTFFKERIFDQAMTGRLDWLVEIGRVENMDNAESPTLVDRCRIECVMHVIHNNRDGNGDLPSKPRYDKDFVAMLYGWATSPVEEHRLQAFRVLGAKNYERLVETESLTKE